MQALSEPVVSSVEEREAKRQAAGRMPWHRVGPYLAEGVRPRRHRTMKVLAGVLALCPTALGQGYQPAQNTQWLVPTPSQSTPLVISAVPGEQRIVTLTLVASKGITKPLTVVADKSLGGSVTVGPTSFGPLSAGSTTTLTAIVNVSPLAAEGTHLSGALLLKPAVCAPGGTQSGGQYCSDDDSTLASFRVKILVAPFSQVTFYPDIANPLMLGFTLPGGDVATIYGQKNTDGTAAAVDGLTLQDTTGALSLVNSDRSGRPSHAVLPGAGTLDFTYLDNSNFTVTATLSNGQRAVVPMTLPSQPVVPSASTALLNPDRIGQPFRNIKPAAPQAALPAATGNATLNVNVTEGGAPLSGATVVATIQLKPVLSSKPASYALPLAEVTGNPGTYTTSFTNFQNAIIGSNFTATCNQWVSTFNTLCAPQLAGGSGLDGVYQYMALYGGCEVLATALAVDTAGLSVTFIPECKLAFGDAILACRATLNGRATSGPGPCGAIEAFFESFDPGGVTITVNASWGSETGNATQAVAAGVGLVQMNINLGASQYQLTPVPPLLVDDEFIVTDIATGQVVLDVPCCSAPIPPVTTFTASIGDVLTIQAIDDLAPCYGFNSFTITNVGTGVSKVLVNGVPDTCGPARPSYPAIYYNGTFTIDF
jgi:hypothetical protein